MSVSATTTIRTERLEQLRQIVTEVLELEPGELTDSSNFVDEHEADSLLAIEILARIERDLGIGIPQEQVAEMTDLSAVYVVVARNAGWESADA
jgi:acyl carrier protein